MKARYTIMFYPGDRAPVQRLFETDDARAVMREIPRIRQHQCAIRVRTSGDWYIGLGWFNVPASVWLNGDLGTVFAALEKGTDG